MVTFIRAPVSYELVENSLVCPDDVHLTFRRPARVLFPQNPNLITDDEQLSVGAFAFQLLQKANEFGRVVAVLQSAITTHVQVADKKIISLPSVDLR